MRKMILFIVSVILMISAAGVFAGDEKGSYTRKCDPEAEEGNRKTLTCWYYNSSGEKAVNPEKGYAGMTDVNENVLPDGDKYYLVMRTYLNADGEPVKGPEGYAKMTVDYELHEDGRVCRYIYNESDPEKDICGYTYRYFDENGDPVIAKNFDSKEGGCAAYSMSMFWTDEGFIQKESYFGPDGELMLQEGKGYASDEWVISSEKEEKRYFGPDGKLIVISEGYARSVYDFNQKTTSYFDADQNELDSSIFSPYFLPVRKGEGTDKANTADLKDLRVGDEFSFGKYEQDNDLENGWEPIEWIVLAEEGGRALVISKYGLDWKPYNERNDHVTWETSNLRAWLNGEFYESVFSPAEKELIAEVTLSNPGGPQQKMFKGQDYEENPTTDKLFLLSLDEAGSYFSEDGISGACDPTAYTEAAGSDTYYSKDNTWYLRTMGAATFYVVYAGPDGRIYDMGKRVIHPSMIRPAFWLEL